MAVPNIFANVTTSIPLSQLDQNFATAITLGNTAVYLGNTTTTLGNLTLTNVTLSSGTSNLASTSIANGTSNVSIASSGGNVVVSTNGVTAVTVDTGQRTKFPTTIGVGGATPSTSGSGITFPATQSASSDANTLDDYEEGTWTPTDGSGAGLSFTSVEATYTKIGRFAFFDFQVVYPSTASGADTRISGFPFNNIDNYEGKPGVCIVSGFTSGFIQQKQGTNYGFIVNASGANVTNSQASTRTARGAQYYATT